MTRKNVKTAGRGTETERHLILVDVENLARNGCPAPLDLAHVQCELHKAIPDFDDALCVVACNHKAAATVAFEFPGARRLWHSGPNGADLALLDEIADLRVMGRFARVTICSGDGIFAGALAALAGVGIETTVVSMPEALSGALRMAAH